MKKQKQNIKRVIIKKNDLAIGKTNKRGTNPTLNSTPTIKKGRILLTKKKIKTIKNVNVELITTPTIKKKNVNDRHALRAYGKNGLKVAAEKKIDKRFLIFNEEYEPHQVVDYDVVIVIPSYNRFKKLNRILKQLHEQETEYHYKIIIYNDGSKDINYGKLPKMYPEINYIKGVENNGKHKYWETITTCFKRAGEYVCNAVIQIDDDFILCDKFIDKLMNSFFEGKKINNKNVAIHYHFHQERDKRSWWGMENGIDGGALFDSAFLNAINNTISPIPLTRWKFDTELSSGVWKQVSLIIHNNGLLTHKLNYSLANHDGNDDSKLNTIQRNRLPIYTWNFKKD